MKDANLSQEEQTFLAQMIVHHDMAVKMSRKMLLSVESHDIESLCYSIIQNQVNEIALMEQMLRYA